ncbi:MAG: single-stranded-DNA-specific exonuclease RecJ, partial [Pyrinomonadaceae bacterium]|nr:single-stranded-DNA-specific exonuclease RecJ [Pyrinomonadaceae bacterium]
RAKGKEHLVKGFLKLVAIGTVADMMSLTGENRAIVALGLADLPNAKNMGLRALMEIARGADNSNAPLTAYDVGFRIAPRINAAGRMDAARTVVELLETKDLEKARELATHLDNRNRERQTMQKEIIELAFKEYMETGGSTNAKHFAVVAGDGWHRGVIGLAASKIAEKLHRPAIVISLEKGHGHGSGRSIKSYHLLQGLESCADLLTQFGGHAQAAGMQITSENIDLLRRKLNEHAAEMLSPEDLIPQLKIDAPVASQTLNLDLVEQLKTLEPFGMGNPKPVFVTNNLRLAREPKIMKEKHYRLTFADESSRTFEGVWWNSVEENAFLDLRVNSSWNVAYTPEANSWNGNTRLQLSIADLQAVES